MLANPQSLAPQRRAPERVRPGSVLVAVRSFFRRLLLHAASLAAAVVAFAVYEHLKLQGATTGSLVALVAAAGLALSPLRAILHEVFAIEGRLLHAFHAVCGLGLTALTLGGVVSGRPVLDRVSLAPFALMGAAQSLMHAPRSAEQAAAVRHFATSLRDVQQVTRAGQLGTAADARQSITVLTRLVSEAQALGETELRSDPAFQGALKRATLRVGLGLGLDAIDEAIGQLAANPLAASAVPDLRKRLAAARRSLEAEPSREATVSRHIR